jgi:prepilin-type N-terminal cleavage/methylation domain-containing protein
LMMCFPGSSHFGSDREQAFTLIELLVVTAIIVLLLSFTVPAVTGLSRSNNLNSAGRTLSNVLTVTRSEAINRRALLRFEVATSWPPDASLAYRKYTVVQHNASAGTDTQLTGWDTLPDGTAFASTAPAGGTGGGTYFFDLNQVQAPSLKFGATDISTVYIEFLPTGALNVPLQNSPVRLRVVPGYVSNGQVTATTSTNWFDASVDALIGRIAISRP